ncbi:unnamed protein product [Periconia digitata]|uniref:Uncharacterized protein n=1 Tax=Periconia digitata TaxID=1303443 RepID=A0A9W4UT07_9PLEO|nr:unnamed protein product [Periconia digitata]
MAAASNGRAKKPGKKPAANGHANGHADKNKANASTAVASPSKTTRASRRSFTGTLTSIFGRLVSWYLIITLLFRCPSSITQLSTSSPRVCKPYLHTRAYVTPYLDPYYQSYVAPQLEKVQPYVDRFDQQFYTPVSTFTKDKYATYGAHRVDQAQKYAEAEWARTVHPQIQNLQSQAQAQYKQHLAPHVDKASEAVSPFYEQTRESLAEVYHLSVLPAYQTALPYAKQGYVQGNHVVTRIIFPRVLLARDVAWKFISRTVWPQVRVLYGDNVEPQLVRIQERLGRYKDQQKVESIVEAVESESTVLSETATSAPTSVSSSVVSSASATSESGWKVLDDFFGDSSESQSSQTSTRTKKPQPTGEALRKKLNDDLRNWQSKFATAADKGAEDLDVRVTELTKRQVDNGVNGHGAALLVQLEEAAESAIASSKKSVIQTVKSLPEEPTESDLNTAFETANSKTRGLALDIKKISQAVRDWKLAYDQETDNLVKAAVASTVEVLEKIHGLGLQEVGMRWAWLDGVTYDDWQKYHKLRNTLDEWQAEVEAVGTMHNGLKVAHEESAKLEDKAMSIVSTTVTELVRLKDVAKWKIWAEDASDDFSTKEVPVRVFKAAQQAAENAKDISSKASEAIIGSETPASESIASAVSNSASAASSKLSESIVGSETPVAESVISAVSESVSAASSKASEAVVGSEPPAHESIASAVSSKASEVADSAASSASSGASVASEKIDVAKEAASEAPKKVFGGVNAEAVPEARQPILDDIIDDDDSDTYSARLQSLFAGAGSRASDLTRAVNEALQKPTKTQGSAESVTSVASEKYAQAVAAASSALFGAEQGAVDSATSVASEQFAQAVTAASYAIYGTPAPTAAFYSVQAQASSRYNDAVSLANEQYTNAKSGLSALVSGTPKPAHQTMFSMIEKAYSDSLAAASERLEVAAQYTDSAKTYVAGPTQGYFESVSSIASSRLSEGISAASAQFTSQPTPALEGARRQYYEAIGLAHARYSDFVGAASSALYGSEQGYVESLASVASESAKSVASQISSTVVGSETPYVQSVASDASLSAKVAASKASEAVESVASQVSSSVAGSETPWAESVASQASQNWESLIAQASNQVYGAPTPWVNSAYSQAGAYAAQATAQAASQYASVQALISELVVGKEPDFTESVMQRFSSAYYTGVPAAVSSVNSYASENYDSVSSYASDAYASASSVVSAVFTPPPAIETILSQANEQLNAAVESASAAVYGTEKGTVEQASESIANAYSSVQAKASGAIYGTQQAQDNFLAVASSAQAAISEAIFGTPTASGYVASATSGAASVSSSISSVASEKAASAASAVSSAVSSAMYGPEQGAVESASSRLAAAVEVANSKIAELYATASKNAEDAAAKASSAATAATQRVKDEL